MIKITWQKMIYPKLLKNFLSLISYILTHTITHHQLEILKFKSKKLLIIETKVKIWSLLNIWVWL